MKHTLLAKRWSFNMDDDDNEAEPEEGFESLVSEFAARKFQYLRGNKSSSQQHDDHGAHKSAIQKHSTDDLFPEPPAIEKYLEIPAAVRRERFFQSISVGDVVEGRVVEKWADDLIIRLDDVYFGPRRWIKDLKIKAECDLSEFKTHSGTRRLSDSISDFDIGDLVRGVVCSINEQIWKIAVSFRRGLLPDMLSHIELGAVLDSKHEPWDSDDDGSYLDRLRSNQCFLNPESINNLVSALGIVSSKPCTFFDSFKSDVHPDEFAAKLRDRQSTKWSMEMVANGVKHFKDGKHEEAMKCFDQALQMHTTNVEAFVARGALKANQNLLKSAIEDFYKALAVHPSHRNGQKYLCETLITLAKQYEKDRLWKDASRRYKEVLQINPEHEEAVDRFHQIQLIISQQVLAGRRISLSVNKAASKLEDAAPVPGRVQSRDLKELLKEKIHKRSKKEKKSKSRSSKKKEKKKRKRKTKRSKSEHLSSSSSSAASTDTDPDATDSASERPNTEDEWVEKVVENRHSDSNRKARSSTKEYRSGRSYSEFSRTSSERSRTSTEERNREGATRETRRTSRSISDERPSGSNSKYKDGESAGATSTAARWMSFGDHGKSSSNNRTELTDSKPYSLSHSTSSEATYNDTKDSETQDVNELISNARYGHSKDSYEKKLKRDREVSSLPSEKLKNKHFSSDEIGFISQLLSKKPKD